jgi:hypothetical protein
MHIERSGPSTRPLGCLEPVEWCAPGADRRRPVSPRKTTAELFEIVGQYFERFDADTLTLSLH